jgi:hypothetical protein
MASGAVSPNHWTGRYETETAIDDGKQVSGFDAAPSIFLLVLLELGIGSNNTRNSIREVESLTCSPIPLYSARSS